MTPGTKPTRSGPFIVPAYGARCPERRAAPRMVETGRMDPLSLLDDPDYLTFWSERHLCTVTTPRPDGTLHVTPMGIVLDAPRRLAWGGTMGHSVKAANIQSSEAV